jgi:hypothetical protein
LAAHTSIGIEPRPDGHTKIMRDYFIEGATYPEKYFCRRLRMHKSLFLTIAKVVEKDR